MDIKSLQFNSLRFRNMMSVLAMAATLGTPFGSSTARIVAKRHRRPHWTRPHQGAGEMARRRRHIEKGTLTASNGLCTSNGRRVVILPFGMQNLRAAA